MDNDRKFTIRQGKITEVEKNGIKSHEYEFKNKEEAIKFMENTDSSHNLSPEDRKNIGKSDLNDKLKNQIHTQKECTSQQER